jgi:type I restriction enzyme S subunit
VAAYLASRAARAYFLRAAKQTTGIASINKSQLSNMSIRLPPISAQRAFVRQLTVAREVAERSERQAATLDRLRFSLQARAFSGQL